MPKKRRGQGGKRKEPVYMDAEYPHLTEDEADVMVAEQRMNDPEISFEEFLERQGYVVVDGKVVEKP